MERFSRQTVMEGFGEEGQKKLKHSTVVIIGCGALGTVHAELLCRAGVGKLILVDFDIVEESNLHRQALYIEEDIGKQKVDACKKRLENIWNEVVVEVVPSYLSLKNISLLDQADVVLDGTDNMETRFLINEYCKKNDVPAIYSSAVLDRGLVLVVHSVVPREACYNCVFAGKQSEEDCGSAGVLNAATHLSGTISASEAIKILLGNEVMEGLFSFSINNNRYEVFGAQQNKNCKVCQGVYEKLSSKDAFSLRFCHRVGGYRADPLNSKATRKVDELEGHKVIVGDYGEVFFPGLRDADIAKRLAEKLVQ